MLTLHKSENLQEIQSCVATIGNFDGIHIGHAILIKKCAETAKKLNLPSVVITFAPHPSVVLSKNPVRPLISLKKRLMLIEDLGVDYCYVIPFTKEFAKQKASQFIEEFVKDNIHCQELIVGYNFLMGCDKVGGEALSNLLSEFHCKLFLQDEVVLTDSSGQSHKLSSTTIRKALNLGDIELVNTFLGREHSVKGKVEHGAKRGSALLGFATANMDTGNLLLPKAGVYATTASFPDNADPNTYKAISNIGYNPTFAGDKLIMETHIIDFDKMIYGENLRVEFLTRIRDEKKFSSIDELIAQLEADKNFRINLNS